MHVSNLIKASKFLILCVFEAEIIDIVLLYIFDELVELVFLMQPAIDSIKMLSSLLVDLWIDVVRSIQEMLIVDLVIGKHRPSKKIVLGVFFLPYAFEMLQKV